jgi:hypothetical protein
VNPTWDAVEKKILKSETNAAAKGKTLTACPRGFKNMWWWCGDPLSPSLLAFGRQPLPIE